MLTDFIPASVIALAFSSSISVPSLNSTSFAIGSITSSASTRPKILSSKLSISSPLSVISVISTPSCVPQSYIVTFTFCATSISFLVRYPAFAVFSAVSARPFLAPWVELKYSRTFRPSRKFDMIGVSMIEPSGFAIRPRIPAS